MSWEVRAMKSGTSFFNGPLFRKTVLRFWPLWASYAFVLFLALPANLAGRLGQAESAADAARLAQYVPIAFIGNVGLVVAPIIGCAAAMAVYSHLYFQRSAAAYGMLPVRREGIFISVTLAGSVPVLLVNLLIAVSCVLAGYSQFDSVLPAAASMFGAMSLIFIAYFGIAAFCAQLTGSMIILPLLFVAVNIAAAVFEEVVFSAMGKFVYGFAVRSYSLDLLSPIVSMAARSQYKTIFEYMSDGTMQAVGYVYTGWVYAGCCAVVGALLTIPSCVLYKRRNLETAGDVVAIGLLRPVLRYCMALACALLLAVLLTGLLIPDVAYMGAAGAVLFALFMLIGGLIGWLVAEMLVQKSCRVFKMGRAWAGFAALWVLLTALLFVCELDLTGYEKRVPDAGEVSSVTLNTSGGEMVLKQPENIELAAGLHRSLVEGKDAYEAAAKHGRASGEDDSGFAPQYVELRYELKDGRQMVRRYAVDYSVNPADIELLEELANGVEGLLSRKLPDVEPSRSTIEYALVNWTDENGEVNNLELSPSEAAELYHECVLPDMKDGTIGLVWFNESGGYLKEVYDCCINIELRVRDRGTGQSYEHFYTYATIWSQRTNAWLAEHGITPLTPAELGNEYLFS